VSGRGTIDHTPFHRDALVRRDVWMMRRGGCCNRACCLHCDVVSQMRCSHHAENPRRHVPPVPRGGRPFRRVFNEHEKTGSQVPATRMFSQSAIVCPFASQGQLRLRRRCLPATLFSGPWPRPITTARAAAVARLSAFRCLVKHAAVPRRQRVSGTAAGFDVIGAEDAVMRQHTVRTAEDMAAVLPPRDQTLSERGSWRARGFRRPAARLWGGPPGMSAVVPSSRRSRAEPYFASWRRFAAARTEFPL
jgi:hypothetical protein